MKTQEKSSCGVIAIADSGELKMKLCWKVAGEVEALVHALRDQFITVPADVYQKALSLGFEGVMVLTRTGRITENGATEDPQKEAEQDHIRKNFHQTDNNPFGRGMAIYMDMTAEFQKSRNAEKAKKR